MEKKELLQRYASHYEAIKRIGEFPISKALQLSDLGDSNDMKALVQRCYKEIRKDDLDISIIDYLCRIATLYLMDMTSGNHREMLLKYSSHKEEVKCFLRYFMKDPLFYLGNDDLKKFQEITSFWFIVLNAENIGDKYWNTKTAKEFMEKITRV